MRADGLSFHGEGMPEPFVSPFSRTKRTAASGSGAKRGQAAAYRPRAASAVRPPVARTAASRAHRASAASDGWGPAPTAPAPSRAGKRERSFASLRRSQRKAKADRAFDRRYADQGAEPAGPRAALYKGQMGASHKKSSRMQAKSSARSAPIPSKRRRSVPTALYAVVAVAACVAFACVLVYPAARDYYVSMRTTAQQQAEYDALVARSDAIQSQVDRLSTSEGIEDQATQELGWVKKGENAVYVNGLDESDSEAVYADVIAGSVPAPDTWYSGVLDPVFGYSSATTKGD